MSRKRKSPARGPVPQGAIPKESLTQKHCITDGKACQERRRRKTNIEKPGYWAVLPARVRYDEELPASAKLLYAEISSLTDQTGYCFASNAYFEQLYGLSTETIVRLLRALEKRGYIRREDAKGGKSQRRIYAGINPAAAAPEDPLSKMTIPPVKNDYTPLSKMTPPTSVSENNNKKPIEPPKAPQGAVRENSKVPAWKPERFEKFWEYYPPQPGGSKPAKARAVKAWDKLRPDDTTIRAMATALQRQKASEQWQRGIGIPYASSWLNGRRWEDEFDAPAEPEEPEAFDEEDLPEWT